MDYLHESAVSIYHRRQRHRTIVTLTFVFVLLFATLKYTAAHVQWGGSAPSATGNASCNRTISKPAYRASDVTINVYNTTPRAGLASRVAKSLESQGFKVNTIDNDPLGKTIPSAGEIRHGDGGASGAIIAAARLPGATLVRDHRKDSSVDLVLGGTFKSLSVPSKVSLSNTARLISMLTPAPSHCLSVQHPFTTNAGPATTIRGRTESGSVLKRVQP